MSPTPPPPPAFPLPLLLVRILPGCAAYVITTACLTTLFSTQPVYCHHHRTVTAHPPTFHGGGQLVLSLTR